MTKLTTIELEDGSFVLIEPDEAVVLPPAIKGHATEERMFTPG
jgi:hypothetical protein